MRRKGYSSFISLINKFRLGKIDHTIETLLRFRFVNKTDDTTHPADCVHIFSENKPVGEHNTGRLNEIDSPLVCIKATDKVSPELKFLQRQLESINARKVSDTGNLAAKLELKHGAKVMLTLNVNLKDRLVNEVGKVMTFKFIGSDVKVIYVKFNDVDAGKVTMQHDRLASPKNWVPIGKVETSFSIKTNNTYPCIKRTQFSLMLL